MKAVWISFVCVLSVVAGCSRQFDNAPANAASSEISQNSDAGSENSTIKSDGEELAGLPDTDGPELPDNPFAVKVKQVEQAESLPLPENEADVLPGISREKVIEILGEPNDTGSYNNSSETFLNYHHFGMSVKLRDDIVDSVFYYSGRKGGYETGVYAPYRGKLPHEISFDSTYAEVLAKFGDPDKSGDNGLAPIPSHWLKYEELGFGLSAIMETGELIYVNRVAPVE